MEIQKLHLKKLNNTRDLGGFPTLDGKRIKSGMLVRSCRLYNLPDETAEKLKERGLKTVIDLRTDRERSEYPATPIDGVENIHLPLVCTATTGITHSRSMAKTMRSEGKRIKSEFGSADNYMKSMYEIILFEESSRGRIRKFFDILFSSEGCVLWNCNSGKDRTGLMAMLIEGLLGVDEELIIDDYVASDRFQRKRRGPQSVFLRIVPMPPSFKRILLAMMKAKPEYIKTAIAEIKKRFGSFEGYFKSGLGFSDTDIDRFRDKYLEE